MRIPTLAVTMAVAALVALPTTATAAAPVAVDDSAQNGFERSVTIDVLANDTDADPDTVLTVTSAAPDAAHGTVECDTTTGENAGECTYTADADWVGADTFNYTVSDGTTSDTGAVTVTTFNVDAVANFVTDPDTGFADSTVKWGESVNIATLVRDPSDAPLSGVNVSLWARPLGGDYAQIFSAVTNGQGRAASPAVTPASTTDYQWRAPGKNSTSRRVSVTPLLALGTVENKRVAVGDTTVINVQGAPADAGDAINLEKLVSGTWTLATAGTFTTGSDSETLGTAVFNIPATESRSTTYRVVMPAESGRNEATSGTVKVKAYDAEIADVEPATTSEFVKITNTGNIALQLKDWELSDADSTLTLPSFSVPKDATVRVYSGNGSNTVSRLYLKGAQSWDNAEGTIALTDNNGFELDTFSYPTVVGP